METCPSISRRARAYEALLFIEAGFISGPMRVNGKSMRTTWLEPDGWSVGIIDQTRLPHQFVTTRLTALEEVVAAIRLMQVRGAPLIGAAAAYGICLALRADASDEALERAYGALLASRPTAINLKWALDEMLAAVRNRPREHRVSHAYRRAAEICDEDVAINQAIGGHGAKLIGGIAGRKKAGEPVQLLTHCNAGSPLSISARLWPRSMSRTMTACRFMSGSTRRDRAIRGLPLPPGSSASMASPTR